MPSTSSGPSTPGTAKADALLAEGVRDQKHAKAGTALQVSFHLSVLPEKVQSVAASVGAELRASLETALTRGGAGGGAAAATANPGAAAPFARPLHARRRRRSHSAEPLSRPPPPHRSAAARRPPRRRNKPPRLSHATARWRHGAAGARRRGRSSPTSWCPTRVPSRSSLSRSSGRQRRRCYR